jgi:hypothetical protein
LKPAAIKIKIMPLGLHSFYGYTIADTHRINNKQDYFIGSMAGDHYADEQFSARLQKVIRQLTNRYANNYSYHWSPLLLKPYKPRTAAQKLATAIKKTTNRHLKKVEQIKKAGYLFEDAFIQEERTKLSDRKELLVDRYHKQLEPQ